MSDRLAALLAAEPGGTPRTIIDSTAYAGRVLLQDRPAPFREATAYVNLLAQAQALLQSEVALLPLDRMLAQEVGEDAGLLEAMAARSRRGYAARALLSDDRVKQIAVSLAFAAVQTLRDPVVLHLPSPTALLRRCALAVDPDGAADFDDEDAEGVAVYYSDWLRAFAGLGISGAVFDERESGTGDEAYGPILNTAEHYRWPIGRRGASELRFHLPERSVAVLGDGFWEGGACASASGLVVVEVPIDAVPERVLERLAELRAGDGESSCT